MMFRLATLLATLCLLPQTGRAQISPRDSEDGKVMTAVRRAELEALVRGGKTGTREAVLLAELLADSGHEAEALDVLRQNAQRNPTDRMALAALARGCGERKIHDEEEAALETLYLLPAPPHQRLECLRGLAIARQTHGRLRTMRDALVKQQEEHPYNAYGWLELAVVQARAGEDQESRRCVYEASKLQPKDVLLLAEIARRQAGYGFITEALRSLDEADEVLKSADTELLRCFIQLESGGQAKATAALASLKLPAEADLALVMAVADKLAQCNAWDEAVRLLNQALVLHASNYQMQYLRAVALEEKGDRDLAVTAFLTVITQGTELDVNETMPHVSRSSISDEISRSLEGLSLPSGSQELIDNRYARRSAYNYRLGNSGSVVCYAYSQVNDAPAGPFITLPQSLAGARQHAVAHLVRLLPCVAAARRAEAEKALTAGGLEKPEVLLEAAGIHSNATLALHPQDPALHAARLLSAEYDDSQSLEVLDAEVELFREAFPQLAFIAACRAHHAAAALEAGAPRPATQPGSAVARREDVLSMVSRVSACSRVVDALISLLPHRYGPEFGQAAAAPTAEELRILSSAADLCLQLPEMRLQSRAKTMALVVRTAMLNNDLPDAIRVVRGAAQSPAPAAVAPPGLTLREPVGGALPKPLAELGITHPLLAALAAEAGGGQVEHAMSRPGFAESRALVAQVRETDARRVLQLLVGDFSEIEAEIQQRLAKPQPTLADHLLTVWHPPASEKGVTGQLKHLAAARALTQDASLLRAMDQQVLAMFGQYKDKLSDMDRAWVIASIERLREVELHPAFTEKAQSVLMGIGSVAEVEQMQQKEEQRRQALYAGEKTLPYSRTAANEQMRKRHEETTRQLAAALKAHDLPAIAALGGVWLAPRRKEGNLRFSVGKMQAELGGQEAFSLLMQTCKPDPASGEAEQMSYAEGFLEVGEKAAALQIYTEIAERDVHAVQPRLRAALQLAEEEPEKALALLRSIRLRSVLPGLNGASPLALLLRGHSTPSYRASVARLITRWVTSTQNAGDLHPLLDTLSCQNLIQMIQEGERGGESAFPYLNQSKDHEDFIIPTGQGATAMKVARQAHDDLCRAMMRLPWAQPVALATLASTVIADDGDLSESARFANKLLRDPQARHSLREWLSSPGAGGERFAGEGYIAMPGPVTILVRHAAQTKDFTTFQSESLPLIGQALGSAAATRAGLYAALFSVPEKDYSAAAAAWLGALPKDPNFSVRNLDEVFNVWQQRALRVDLAGLLIKSYAGHVQLDMGNVPEVMKRYFISLIATGRREDGIAFYKTLRDEMISGDAAERRRLIAEWHAWTASYRSDPEQLNRRPEPTPATKKQQAHVYSFASWLKHALQDPALIFLLPLVLEENLLDGPNELRQVAYEMAKPEMLRSPAAVMDLADQLGFLADAPGWRNHILSPDSETFTWISSLAGRVRDEQDTQPLRQLLAARQPTTLGSEIFAALLIHSRSNLIEIGKRTSEEHRDVQLHEVLKRRQAELASIAPTQRRAFSLLLRTELSGYPDLSRFDASLAAALQPFLDAEADDLLPLLDRILAAKEWSEVGMGVSEFAERFPVTLAQAARRHPAKAEAVVRHACGLLRKTPEDKKQRLRGWSGGIPVGRFIWELGQVPQVLGTSMSLAEGEKLPEDPSWAQSFTGRVTDYKLMHDRGHVAALFTRSPLVADTAQFSDFAVPARHDYESATLLDSIITALNREHATAQWLQEHLKARPEQTFGIQLTLALLQSTAPLRKIVSHSNNAHRDAAPLLAFAAAHAQDFSRLSPAAGGVVRRLLERHLHSPSVAPEQVRDLLKALPPAPDVEKPQSAAQIPANLR